MLSIYDARNYLREQMEVDRTGYPFRNVTYTAQHMPGLHIFVWDGHNGNRRRREIYQRYKDGRPRPQEDVNPTLKIFELLLQMTSAIQVEVPGWEADDVIATLVRKFAGTVPITIFSKDLDLKQLELLPNVTTKANPKPDVPTKHIRLFKTLVGDVSDKISGFPGFGEQAWKTTARNAWYPILERIEHEEDPQGLSEVEINSLDVSNLVRNRLEDPAGTCLLRDLWKITGLWDVPHEEIDKHWVVGKPNPVALEEFLRSNLQ